ncbi:hypothetical protein CGRA01v4_13464 [Colletotrichum graminicola]|nr:hypothetical protein CGRA01v4_13464 [Colletotrichum graminicola]
MGQQGTVVVCDVCSVDEDPEEMLLLLLPLWAFDDAFAAELGRRVGRESSR